MSPDQIINWLYNNFDTNAYEEAKRNGTAFVYLSGIVRNITGNAPTAPRVNRAPLVANEAPRVTPRRNAPAPPVQDLNEEPEEVAAAPARTPRQNQTNTNNDRVRVGRL